MRKDFTKVKKKASDKLLNPCLAGLEASATGHTFDQLFWKAAPPLCPLCAPVFSCPPQCTLLSVNTLIRVLQRNEVNIGLHWVINKHLNEWHQFPLCIHSSCWCFVPFTSFFFFNFYFPESNFLQLYQDINYLYKLFSFDIYIMIQHCTCLNSTHYWKMQFP